MSTAFDQSGAVQVTQFENSIETREREELATEIRPQIIAEVQEQVLRRIRAHLEGEHH